MRTTGQSDVGVRRADAFIRLNPAPAEDVKQSEKALQRLPIKTIAISCGAIIAFVWLTWPHPGQIKIDTCTPDGPISKWSAFLYGKGFWRAQLKEIARKSYIAENWDQIEKEAGNAEKKIRAIYKQYFSKEMIKHYDAGRRADPLRRKADEKVTEIELEAAKRQWSAFMRKLAPILHRCERTIRANMQER